MKKVISIISALLICLACAGYAGAMEADVLGGVEIHGFISQGYIDSTDNNFLSPKSSDGTFAFNEMGINFNKQLTDKLRIGLQIFSRDLGAIGNNDVTIDWAFADYRWKDWLGLRAGKIKAPYGLYNEIRDTDVLRTSIFLPQGIYDDQNRDANVAVKGMGLYGEVPADQAGSFSYYVLAGTVDVKDGSDSGPSRQFINAGLNPTGNWEFDTCYFGALTWMTPLDGLLFKYTYRAYTIDIPTSVGGNDATFETDQQIGYVWSTEYTWNDLVLAAEYMKTRAESQLRLDATGIVVSDGGIAERVAYYVSASYRINDWLEVGSYYTKYYFDTADKDGSDGVASGRYQSKHQAWQEDTALSFRFDINESWSAKVEGHILDGTAQCLTMDNPDGLEEEWYMLATKLSFSF